MIRFLIYLFETGMCLSLLFLVYFLFLRKETYFTFNRIYLLSILVLSFALPLLHMNITMPGSKSMESAGTEIKNIKDYYERLIAMTDPDYRNSFTTSFKEKESVGFEESGQTLFPGSDQAINVENSDQKSAIIKTGFWADVNWARILLILYLIGTLFFTARLLLLFRWLRQTVNKYGSTFNGGVKLVKMDEEVPPFSFFRFVFLHYETTTHSGFSQILAHEKVHIAQRHSLDLIFAHLLTIVQWFNPFAWLINNAMKTNHEYIADRNVVEQGYELFDYQSLLLKQMISIRSVELVNNFNLINIKKRIAMMTRIKSGLAAQVKALVVIPAAMFVFFFFAEITFAQDKQNDPKDLKTEVQGFWQNTDDASFGQLLNFKGDEVQVLDESDEYRVFKFEFINASEKDVQNYFEEHHIPKIYKNPNEVSALLLTGLSSQNPVYLNLKGDELTVQWSWGMEASTYKKVNAKNSLEIQTNKIDRNFNPVSTSFYRISDSPENTYYLLMDKNGKMLVDGQTTSLENLPDRIRSIKSEGDPFSASEKIPVVVVDAECQMANVNALYQKMRDINELRYILSVKPMDAKVPEVFYQNVGIPRLLPPKDAVLMEEEAVEKSGMKIIRIDLTKGITPTKAATAFDNDIQKDKRFVVLLSYEDSTKYKEYVGILDEFYKAIYAKRNELAQEKYQLDYDELADAHQKEVRKSLPMIITERDVDQMEE